MSRRKGRKKGSGVARVFRAFFLLVVLGALAAGAAAWFLLVPFGPQGERFVEVAPRSSAMQIGAQLETAGVVRSQWAFAALRLWKRGTLRAGEYRFDHPVSAAEVYRQIVRGEVFTLSVTIPEGASIFDVAARMEQAGLGDRQSFLTAAASQTALIADLDSDAKSLEGYLFPDTYRFQRKASPEQICATMVRRFRSVAGQIGLKGNVHRVVTLASVVERETAVDAERPLVASVFQNRLAKKMALMTDPAVIYGLELQGRWRGTLYKSDLSLDTPYNTYVHTGLPPGPIANPGVRSLRAALAPAQTDYLYFVASGANPQGHSLFARTLDEHNQNVADYRHAVKKAGGR